MKKIVLIGGIGSGKTTIAAMFAQLGAGIISLDAIGHNVIELPEVKRALREAFGDGVFDDVGHVIRPALAAAAFDAPEHTLLLNGITHPAIFAERDRQFVELGKRHDVVLVEVTSGVISREEFCWADGIVAVSAPEELRVARSCARGGHSEADVRSRMARQLTDAQREAVADFVIHNDASLEKAREQVQSIWDAITQDV